MQPKSPCLRSVHATIAADSKMLKCWVERIRLDQQWCNGFVVCLYVTKTQIRYVVCWVLYKDRCPIKALCTVYARVFVRFVEYNGPRCAADLFCADFLLGYRKEGIQSHTGIGWTYNIKGQQCLLKRGDDFP